MEPTAIGKIVSYKLSATDATNINRRRDAYAVTVNPEPGHPWVGGAQAHIGNSVAVGDVFPAIVVRVWPPGEYSNLQVYLDGNDVLWAMSVKEGDEPGEWTWPPRL